jgi:hypothetical protein
MIKSIIIQVSLEDENTDSIAKEVCAIEVEDIRKVRASDLTDACQRAVAHCIDELQKDLDISR